jgi:hypothetical protein
MLAIGAAGLTATISYLTADFTIGNNNDKLRRKVTPIEGAIN